MKLGQRATFFAGRALRAFAGILVATAACLAVALGLLPRLGEGTPTATHIIVMATLCVVLVSSIVARVSFRSPTPRAQRLSRLARWAPALVDVEMGLALVACVQALLYVTDTPLAYPAVYVLVAFAATFLSTPGMVAVLLASVAFEGHAVWLGTLDPMDAVSRVGILCLFAILHVAFIRGLIAQKRRQHRVQLEKEVQAMRDEARDFRLISAPLGADSRVRRPRALEEAQLAAGAVETIRASMYYTLEMLKKSLDLHTCVLLWLDHDGSRLKIKELVTDSDCIVETSVPADAGAVGAIVRDRIHLNLKSPKRGHVPYYAGPEEIGAFLGIPVIENGHLRGVLCADRHNGHTFAGKDEALLLGAAEQILRAIQNERVFSAVERSKYEHERFYHASAKLGRALTPEQVMDTAVEAAREIVEFDLATISLFDRETRKHRVCRVHVRDDASNMVDVERLDGLEFRDNAGLAAMVVKNKHYLPAGGEMRDQSTPVFTRRIKMKNVESLLVLPLICADEAIGTFALASRQRHAFGKDARDMLGVICNQVAVSIDNAQMYRRMETMATTDGLTGLLNHRAFQDRLTDMLARSERNQQPTALILTDIDHFKAVNDTHGHPVGDQVLREVAKVMEKCARKIDVVARYGGEEFVIVIEGTDAEGARRVAERVREDVAKCVFQSDAGPFRVTMSLGIADYPADASDKATLVERADQALYFGKENGRNRSVTHATVRATRTRRAS